MYFLPEGTGTGVPTAEDLENAVDITEALVGVDVVTRLPVAPRAERRACAKQGHQRKGGWTQCANCGSDL